MSFVSYTLLPVDIKQEVLNPEERFPLPNVLSKASLQALGREIVALSSVNKETSDICQKRLSDIKSLFEIVSKYNLTFELYPNDD